MAYAIKRFGNKPWVYSSDYPHEVNNEFCKHEISELLENNDISDADTRASYYGAGYGWLMDGLHGLVHRIEDTVEQHRDEAVRAGGLHIGFQPDLGVQGGALVAGGERGRHVAVHGVSQVGVVVLTVFRPSAG